MTTYRTLDGDMVDQIVFDHYGSHDMVETVLDINPGLSAIGAILPKGVLIELPDLAVAQPRSTVRLWD